MYKKFCLLLMIAVGSCYTCGAAQCKNGKCYNCQPAVQSAAMRYGIKLNPGETLVSVNGIPVGQLQNQQATASPQQATASPQQATASPQHVSVHPLQAWAEEEARMMANRGTCGHIRSAPSGCFVGVGCGVTCMGYGRLVAEAHYQGKTVRVWQR